MQTMWQKDGHCSSLFLNLRILNSESTTNSEPAKPKCLVRRGDACPDLNSTLDDLQPYPPTISPTLISLKVDDAAKIELPILM